MPINPITKEEQIYPTLDDLEHFRSIEIEAKDSEGNPCEIAGKKFVKDNLSNGKYYSFLFAIVIALKEHNQTPDQKKIKQRNDQKDELVDIYASNPEISVWLSELIQNAVDASWGDGIGATDMSIDFTKDSLTFIHNGRPPQFLGFALNEFESMFLKGSTKKGDLKSEGRFGIGFKFWRFFFQNVSLEASGWQIGWNDSLNFGEITESEFTDGMKLTFSNPTEICKGILSNYIDSIDLLFNDGLDRLIEGVAIQTNPLDLHISVNGEMKYELKHIVSNYHHNLSESEVKLFEIKNKLKFDQESLDIDIYVPERLIGCDYLGISENVKSKNIELLKKTLSNEYSNKLEAPSIERILETYSEVSGFETTSQANINFAANESINYVQSVCMFDLSADQRYHHTLYSLFPINKNRQKIQKQKILNRILFLGTYIMDRGREFMLSEPRNTVLMRLQYESSLILKSILIDSDFRMNNNISNRIYIEILESFSNGKIDKDFINSIQEEID